MANTVGTSTNALATAYPAGRLVAISNDGTALVLWWDGSRIKYSYSVSPYTSWTTANLISQTIGNRWEIALYHNTSNDTAVVVTSDNSGNMVSYTFTYNTSTHVWSPGTQHTVVSAGGAFNGSPVAVDKDKQGRYWAIFGDNSGNLRVFYSADAITWTSSLTAAIGSGGYTFSLAVIGNYTVIAYATATGVQTYNRIDSSAASLGAWKGATTFSPSGLFFDNTSYLSLRGAAGTDQGMLLASDFDTANVLASRYDASTDTWAAATTIGSANQDHNATLVQVGGDLYALWSKYTAANNFSLVYKKWTQSTNTWDAASTQLEPNGTNIALSSADYNATAGKLVFVYLVGTANPWTVTFDTLAISGGGGGTQQDIKGTGAVVASATLNLTVRKPLFGNLASAFTASTRLSVIKALAGNAGATAGASLSLTISKKLAGVLAGTSSATLALTVTKLLAGSASAQAAASLNLFVGGPVRLLGSASIQTVTRLALTVEKHIAGSAPAQMSTSLVLSTEKQQDIYGSAAIIASASLNLTRSVLLSGQAAGQANASILLSVRKALAGTAPIASAGSLRLTVIDMHYRQPTGEVTLLATITASVALLDDLTATIELLPGPEGTIE